MEVVGDLNKSCFIGMIRVSLRKRKEKLKTANIDVVLRSLTLKGRGEREVGELDRKGIEILFTEL